MARSITCKQQIKVGCVLVKPKANHGSLLAEETSYFSPTDLYLLHFFHPWSYTFYQYRERKVEAKGHLNNVSSLINLYLVKKKQNDRCGLFKMTAQLSVFFQCRHILQENSCQWALKKKKDCWREELVSNTDLCCSELRLGHKALFFFLKTLLPSGFSVPLT